MFYISASSESAPTQRGFVEDEEGWIEVSFPDHEDDDAPKPDPRSPEAWANNAGIRVKDDAIQVWISTGDPRGGFQMEVRMTEDGELVLNHPYPGEGLPHEETVERGPGALLVARTRKGE